MDLKKYITASVSIRQQITRIDKKNGKNAKTISYRLHFIDSARFMTNLLSNLVNNHAAGIHKIKCKY